METMRVCNICSKEKHIEEFRRMTGLKNKFNKGCRECVEKNALYYKQNKESAKAYQKAYREAHKEKAIAASSQWRKSNKDVIRAWENKRYDENPKHYWVKTSREKLRGLIRKGFEFEFVVGCTFSEFKTHIERLFQPGMGWDNYGREPGQWSLDHKVAMDKFEVGDPMVHHYTNLQPMWCVDNSKKGKR